MSIRIMSEVWQDADADGGKLLLLLALADHAGDDGWCWPAVETLARMARLSRRHTQRLLRDLEAEGQIQIEERDRTTSRYRVLADKGRHIVAPDAEVTPGGDARVAEGVTPVSPEPSVNRQGEPSEKKESKLSEEIGIVWTYYVEKFNATRQVLDSKRKTIIRNALKVRSLDECKRAIDGLYVSEHHNGGPHGTGKKYLGIQYALKGRGDNSTDTWIDHMIDVADAHGGISGVHGSLPRDHPRILRNLEYVRYAWKNQAEKQRGREGLNKLREYGYNVKLLEGGGVELYVQEAA
jgi:hypothetical protein